MCTRAQDAQDAIFAYAYPGLEHGHLVPAPGTGVDGLVLATGISTTEAVELLDAGSRHRAETISQLDVAEAKAAADEAGGDGPFITGEPTLVEAATLSDGSLPQVVYNLVKYNVGNAVGEMGGEEDMVIAHGPPAQIAKYIKGPYTKETAKTTYETAISKKQRTKHLIRSDGGGLRLEKIRHMAIIFSFAAPAGLTVERGPALKNSDVDGCIAGRAVSRKDPEPKRRPIVLMHP